MLYRVATADTLLHIRSKHNLITSFHKNVLIIDKSVNTGAYMKKIKVDAIVITGNPVLYLDTLAKMFDCTQYVADASNPVWKIRKWKKDAESLHLRLHSVAEQGAFIMEL